MLEGWGFPQSALLEGALAVPFRQLEVRHFLLRLLMPELLLEDELVLGDGCEGLEKMKPY